MTIGLVLHRDGSTWTAGLGSQLPPDTLREAAQPLPLFADTARPRILVGGSFGEARVAALDADGRLLGYGPGAGSVLQFALCPARRRLVELYAPRGGLGPPYRLAVRDVRTLAVLSDAPAFRAARDVWAGPLMCADSAGKNVVGFVTPGSPVSLSLVRVRDNTRLWSGIASAGVFGGRRAFVLRERSIVSVGLDGSGETVVARVPVPEEAAIAAAPDGLRVAVSSKAYVATVNVSTGRQHTITRAQATSRVAWLGPSRIALYSRSGIAIYDAAGRLRASIPQPAPNFAVVLGGRVVGVGNRSVFSASLTGGAAREVARVATSVTSALVAV